MKTFGFKYIEWGSENVKIIDFKAESEDEANKKAMNFSDSHEVYILPLGEKID